VVRDMVRERGLPTDIAHVLLRIDLSRYLRAIRCPKCHAVRAAADFLKTWKRIDGRVWMFGDARLGCQSCAPPPAPFPVEPGVRIKELRDESGTPMRWRQRTREGEFGPHHAMESMELLHDTARRVFRPQPRRDRARDTDGAPYGSGPSQTGALWDDGDGV
jgi:hypothetical protein